MERRNFLRLAFGVAAGAAVLTASAQAAPLAPQSIGEVARTQQGSPDAHPAVTTSDELAQLKPEQVHWHGHWHGGWHRRHWGWRHPHWHHRHWRRW